MKLHMDQLVGCVDCLCYIANGDVPEDRPTLPQDIAANWPEPGLYIVIACEEECEGWFSWRSCDICGATLGGNRHPFAVLCDHEECAA